MQSPTQDDSKSGAAAAIRYARKGRGEAKMQDLEKPTETTPLVAGQDNDDGNIFGICIRNSKYIEDLEHCFGWRLLVLLCATQHILKGFVANLVGQARPYLYRSFKVPAPQVQVYSGIVGLPWAMKPIMGLISDIMPIGGYHKAPYMLAMTILSIVAFLVISFYADITVSLVVVCLVCITLQISTTDLLSEARYASKIQVSPHAGPALLTYVWAGINAAGFVSVLISGPLLENFGAQATFMAATLPAALVLVPVALGYLEEKRVTPEELAETRQKYYDQREACFLCVIMLIATLTIMAAGLFQHDPYVNCAVAVTVGTIVLICFSLCLTPVIAKANVYSVLSTALGASTSGASFYFYTDSPEMYPEGPHFSDFFYNTVMGTAGTVFSLVGIYLYQRYLSELPYRSLVVGTSVVISAFSVLDVMMFARLTVKWGIPDHILVLGLSVFETMIWQWQWMPQVVLLAALCPKGMEATMFALLAGCHNLGNTISSNFGAVLLHILGVKPKGDVGESKAFENLWIAAAISSVLPLIAALLLKNLLPDCKQSDKIDAVGDPTKDSLLRRWLQADRT
eukprot:TRINITY_DN20987_c0_g1_i1.p1 TRINITY_DN20987_c0_g1~~TRINITY_DN20987_c0_g1_i1.p1  ORF type:complete len:604 (+),score=104.67 TRINITY_DN20987_c0_g1_i1:108-1814(+)